MFPYTEWDEELFSDLQDAIRKYNNIGLRKDAIKIRDAITKLRKWFDEEYKDILKPKTSGKRYWFENDPTIKLPPHFMNIYNELYSNTISWTDKKTNELISQAGGKSYPIDKSEKTGGSEGDVCVIPNFKAISIKFGITEGLVRKYVKAMANAGVLKKLKRKIGSRGAYIYSIGYWQTAPVPDEETGKQEFLPTRREFIRQAKNREQMKLALQNFRL